MWNDWRTWMAVPEPCISVGNSKGDLHLRLVARQPSNHNKLSVSLSEPWEQWKQFPQTPFGKQKMGVFKTGTDKIHNNHNQVNTGVVWLPIPVFFCVPTKREYNHFRHIATHPRPPGWAMGKWSDRMRDVEMIRSDEGWGNDQIGWDFWEKEISERTKRKMGFIDWLIDCFIKFSKKERKNGRKSDKKREWKTGNWSDWPRDRWGTVRSHEKKTGERSDIRWEKEWNR